MCYGLPAAIGVPGRHPDSPRDRYRRGDAASVQRTIQEMSTRGFRHELRSQISSLNNPIWGMGRQVAAAAATANRLSPSYSEALPDFVELRGG